MKLTNFLSEVKDRKQPEGMPDPALLTYDEYYKVANPSDKWHPDEAYQTTGSLPYLHYENFKPLRRFKSRGLEFELMVQKEEHRYVKTNLETGEVVRDENGLATYWTPEEMKAMNKSTEDYTFAIFHKGNAVAAAQDEWGALLILVVSEFQGFGLGPILGKVARSMEPYADSGGFTPGGEQMLRKVHREFVKDYMANGMYSQLVRSGQVTVERVKKILDSANLKYKQTKKTPIGSSGKWKLWSNDTNAWIVYDENLRNVIDELQSGKLDLSLSKNLILAFCFIEGESPSYLYQLQYSDELAGRHALSAAIAHVDSYDDILTVRESKFFANTLENARKLGYDISPGEPFPEPAKDENAKYQQLAKRERKWRNSFDEYGEFEISMQEMAEKLYNE